MAKDKTKEIEEAVKVWLGRAILLKYAGYGLFALSLGLIILSSLLHAMQFMSWLQTSLMISLALIVIGMVAEKVLME